MLGSILGDPWENKGQTPADGGLGQMGQSHWESEETTREPSGNRGRAAADGGTWQKVHGYWEAKKTLGNQTKLSFTF